ncbi:WG repeat-containing protein [Tropicimonas isoalkanivorans]|uniref:WG containing repeat-containing protein n=1 Tax=Tropicimonas isoalkanivorans TaxID=441112 RepID=A0A1I1N0E2_9RHOB|nr:WG repeat-containing protein [Tropicimonas isoalkanivorans]SFC91174.1 WG containing repeat-containing protein [Tropicimonas isoalkanivorans]
MTVMNFHTASCVIALVCAGSMARAEMHEMPVGAGAPPCGSTVATAGPVLFPMPQDGQWGYVDREGSWQLEPQWAQARDFHEARAAVGSERQWGIIDTEGIYVVEPRYESDTIIDVDGSRWIDNPFKPYSEGCTVAHLFVERSLKPFLIDREGRTYWRDELPADLRGMEIRDFGTFSEGLAWFQDGTVMDASYGWIDPTGAIAIEPEFVEAGDFVGGLAPAAARDGQAGFISTDGQLQLPRKWTLDAAEPFSEGLAQVWTGPFDIAFMTQSDFAFSSVTDRDGTEGSVDMAGAFADGLAPVLADFGNRSGLVYVNQQGDVALVPDEIDGVAVCDPRQIPEFLNGLARLVVADDGEDCGEGRFLDELPSYDAAHYVYIDTAGEVVLREQK